MGRLPLLIVFGALLALTCAQNVPQEKIDSENHTSTIDPPITFPTTKPTTTPTTPMTTPTPPTTKTTKATTTPTTPTTTTTPPTTSTIPTTTTKPTPTPPPPPTTTTPKPEPPTPPKNVDPQTGEWRVNYTSVNGSCIFAEMAVQIEVPYLTLDKKNWTAYVDIPKNATSAGNCDNNADNLILTWGNNSVAFTFAKKENKTWYGVEKLQMNVYKDNVNFPNADNTSQFFNFTYDKMLFNTTEKMSYKCAKVQTFNLTDAASNTTLGFLHFSHLQLQAFSDAKATGFADAVDCEPSGTPDIVPIAAGCALAALIVIVLAAYLIGRRRSQNQGYLSM